jgi:hypothetical protein
VLVRPPGHGKRPPISRFACLSALAQTTRLTDLLSTSCDPSPVRTAKLSAVARRSLNLFGKTAEAFQVSFGRYGKPEPRGYSFVFFAGAFFAGAFLALAFLAGAFFVASFFSAWTV